ncbi:P-loop containing nucleoside triphosphate hydrolase protein [Chytridium lagenaria]|nr:P-loop containing nucleoside triphosphate hydrolase protein [Chytridium lagenaria]
MSTSGLANVKHIILVLSGKGGVGKSTVTTELALSLWRQGAKRVGILDVDLTGEASASREFWWIPVWADESGSLSCMSIGFLLKGKDDAVIWRGPKKTAMIKQFIEDVVWGELDYLIVDTPPGTSDEHISLVEYLKEYNPDGAVLVTTPQAISVLDVRKELSFCKKVGIPILGVIENMSGYVCPHCEECTNLFSKGGGEALAKEHDLPFLAASEGGFIANFEKSALSTLFRGIADEIDAACHSTTDVSVKPEESIKPEETAKSEETAKPEKNVKPEVSGTPSTA